MPLFGSKKEKKLDIPEVVDFSNDTWSYKGTPPDYQFQSDGFTYDVVDADGNDKNAISLGLSGMLIIVLNAKGPKIKEDELLPQFGKVIKTRNWHSMTVKEANFLVQTAIKKLTNSATSGDVFDLASYAPLEVKRVLLKTLFTMSRIQLPPEVREEAEHRIIDDIVPDIFANPDYELALLTGLIVKTDDKAAEPVPNKIETSPVLDQTSSYSAPSVSEPEIPTAPSIPEPEPDSAFAELQKIYGRRVDTMPVINASAQRPAVQENNINENPIVNPAPVIKGNETDSKNHSSSSPAKQNNPFTVGGPANVNQNSVPAFSSYQPANPFAGNEPRSIPQPAAPNFFGQQPGNMNMQTQYQKPQNIPVPPVPNYGQQQNNPFAAQPNQQGFQQYNPYLNNQQYPNQQYMQQGMLVQPNASSQNFPQSQFPPYGWQQGNQQQQYSQNMQGYYPNQNQAPMNNNQQGYPNNQPNRGQNYPQQTQQNSQNN